MTMTRRNVLAVLAASTAISASPGHAAPRRKLPKGFLWGAAISAHQSEGNDINSDS
jgi:beta-glucosidase